MKRSSVVVLIGIVILLVGIEILLIYIACTTQANGDITFNYRDVNKTGTRVPTNPTTSLTTVTTGKSEKPTKETTVSDNTIPTEITNVTTESSAMTTSPTISNCTLTVSPNIPTKKTSTTTTAPETSVIEESSTFDMTTPQPIPPPSVSLPPTRTLSPNTETTIATESSTAMSSTPFQTTSTQTTIQCKTQCETNVTYPSSFNTTPPYPITAETTTNKIETTPITTAFPTTSTTLSTNVTIFTTTALETTKTSTRFPITTTTMTTTALTSSTSSVWDEENQRFTIPKFNYVLRHKKGVACVLANMTIQIYSRYRTRDFQPALTVPTNITPTGSCNETIANMTLSWVEPAKNQVSSHKENKITFIYAHDNVKFFLDSILVDVYINEKRRRRNTTNRSLKLFSAALKYEMFICKTDTTINFDRINVVISDIILIVFNECFGNCTRTGINCTVETGIKILTIVGIVIVGILLYVILFVFYLHGKK